MIEVGLLWQDNTVDDLPGSVKRAAARYQERFGIAPNAAYCNPEHLPSGEITVDGLPVHPLKSVLKGHLWVGRERQE